MFQIVNGIATGTMNGCQRGESYLQSVGYQSSSNYLALPDILRTSFHWKGASLGAKDAPASSFDAFISCLVKEVSDVDRTIWPIHQRWRVINACLAEKIVTLVEVEGGFLLQLPEVQPEEKSSE